MKEEIEKEYWLIEACHRDDAGDEDSTWTVAVPELNTENETRSTLTRMRTHHLRRVSFVFRARHVTLTSHVEDW